MCPARLSQRTFAMFCGKFLGEKVAAACVRVNDGSALLLLCERVSIDSHRQGAALSSW
jgi:hypothetical protein